MIRKTLFLLTGISLILLLFNSCQVGKLQPDSAPATASETGGLSPDQIATLNSLERVDEYPLYVMHYQGEYSSGVSNFPFKDTGAAWACSLFAAMGDEDQKLYGRNFDWRFSPALLLFTDPPDGYASVSMVDIAYLGFDNKAENLAELPLAKRQALLQAPYLPFDGMNEYGLAIGMAAVPESKMPHDANKPDIDSLAVIREILDHARTVDEAVAIFGKYNIDWGGGPALHYLIADNGGDGNRSGESVLVEFSDGKMVVLPNDNPWHLATNHLRVNAQGDGGCDRYAKIRQQLTDSGGKITASRSNAAPVGRISGGRLPNPMVNRLWDSARVKSRWSWAASTASSTPSNSHWQENNPGFWIFEIVSILTEKWCIVRAYARTMHHFSD